MPAVDLSNLIQTVLIYALPVLFAITVHEAAHGYAARHFGDNTAAMMGRITLNPIKHIDPIGTLLMPLLLYFATSGAFLFGYAKPVPVRFDQLRNPKRDMIWVALAGPASNFVQALLWGVLLVVLVGSGVGERFLIEMCRWGFFIVMGLVIAGVVGSLWLRPLMDLGYAVIDFALTPLIALLR
jgi:Zn-dependent protease